MKLRTLHHVITGISTLIGKIISMDEFAELAGVPDRKGSSVLDGAAMQRIVGIRSKSWDPAMFRDIETVASIGAAALRSARLTASDMDAVLVVTCTPYQLMLDQDTFLILRLLGIPDDVVPIQLSAGCAGLARAVSTASRLDAENILVLTYNLPSLVAGDGKGRVRSDYCDNAAHPLGHILWASPAIFSDAAAAMVLSRRPEPTGFSLYSRDSLSFGDEPGFTDPLIHYLGGGANHPPGTENADKLSCYGMNGEEVKRYYTEGMMLNHQAVGGVRPDYVEEVRRIYTHQASPALIEEFAALANLPPHKVPSNARQLGNLVTPCTLKMLHDDLVSGEVRHGDEICVSVVGAGPERGTFIMPVEVAEL